MDNIFNNKNTNCECLLCNKKFNPKNTIGLSGFYSHLKRIHKISHINYIQKFYRNLNPEFTNEKCGFCDENAYPCYEIDNTNKQYKIFYDGYFCKTEKCKNLICFHLWGDSYKNSIKKFEHIGSVTWYLSKKFKISMEEAIEMKKFNIKSFQRNSKNLEISFENAEKIYKEKLSNNSTLKGFIERHGEKIGIEKYNERCSKISNSNTLNWYQEHFGILKGSLKYEGKILKFENSIKQNKNRTSKNERLITSILKEKFVVDIQKNYDFNGKIATVDMFLPNEKIAIDYYGVYWHASPDYYDSNYFHKPKNMYAHEIWKIDKKRRNEFKRNFQDFTLIILWERDYSKQEIFSIVETYKNLKEPLSIQIK